MKRPSESDIEYCENAACVPGSIFSVSYRYSRPEFRNHLLCVHALVNEIRSIPFKVTEPEVARIKIAWWQSELLAGSLENSQHPLLRGIRDCDVLEGIDLIQLAAYFKVVSDLASGSRITSLDQLVVFARGIGGTEALLAYGKHCPPVISSAVVFIGQAGFLNRLLHDWDCKLCSENWWLPLNIQAKYGISIGSARNKIEISNSHKAMLEISQLAINALNEGLDVIGSLSENEKSNGLHHLLIYAVVLKQRLMRLVGSAGAIDSGHHRLLRFGVRENFAAWRQAIRN